MGVPGIIVVVLMSLFAIACINNFPYMVAFESYAPDR